MSAQIADLRCNQGRPMPTDYTVVFDVSQAVYRVIPMLAIGLFFVAIGVWKLRNSDLPTFTTKTMGKPFSYFFLGFAVLWTVLAGWSMYACYRHAAQAVAQHRAKVVEGRVQDFWPMPYEGHGMEHFCVADACFEYSDYIVTAGFNNTASHGGPIREGLPVRVSYVGNTIVRLEVANSPPR